jgi:MFS family permease
MVADVFFIMMISWGIFLSFGVFFEPVLDEFGWTRAATSAAYSISIVLSGFLSIFCGKVTDTFGPRLVMTGCGFFLGLGYWLMSTVSSVWQLYLFFGVVVAIGMSATFVPANTIVARWFFKKRGLMTGIVLSGNGVGTIIVPPITRWLISSFGWRTAYTFIAVAAFVLIILAAQILKREPADVGKLAYGLTEEKEDPYHVKVSDYSLGDAIHTWQLWVLCIMSFCIWLCVGIIMVHIVIHATGQGISSSGAITVLVIIGASSIPSKVIMGGIADRIGNKSAFIISFIIMSCSFLWLMAAQGTWMFIIFGIIFGFAYGALSPLMSPMVAEFFGIGSHGVILGFTFLLGEIGEAIGPVMAGRIFDLTNSYGVAFLLGAVISTIGFLLCIWLKPIDAKRLSATYP